MVDMSAAAEMLTRYQADAEGEEKRLLAWRHCYEAFGEALCSQRFKTQTREELREYLALHLYAYMASFGMIRGGQLKQENYQYLLEAVDIVLQHPKLRGITFEKLLGSKDLQKEWETLFDAIQDQYPSDSNLFVLKILMGTLGCFPAVDTYVKEALKGFRPLKDYPNKKFGEFEPEKFELFLKGFKNIYDEICEYPVVIEFMKKYPEYPEMRIVDMVLWQIGKGLYKNKNKKVEE